MRARVGVCAVLLLAAGAAMGAQATPVELGRVPWLRDYATGLQTARASTKPLLVLFDEVPG